MIFAELVREQAIPSFNNFSSRDASQLHGCFGVTRALLVSTVEAFIAVPICAAATPLDGAAGCDVKVNREFGAAL